MMCMSYPQGKSQGKLFKNQSETFNIIETHSSKHGALMIVLAQTSKNNNKQIKRKKEKAQA